jgi:hypothetical protein
MEVNPLHRLCMYGTADEVREYVAKHGVQEAHIVCGRHSALGLACVTHRADVLEVLMEYGVKVDTTIMMSVLDDHCLKVAVDQTNDELLCWEAMIKYDPQCVNRPDEHGRTVLTDLGMTNLHVFDRHMRFLVEHGANPNCQHPISKRTSLHWAALRNKDLFYWLLNLPQANVYIRDKFNKQVKDYCQEGEDAFLIEQRRPKDIIATMLYLRHVCLKRDIKHPLVLLCLDIFRFLQEYLE